MGAAAGLPAADQPRASVEREPGEGLLDEDIESTRTIEERCRMESKEETIVKLRGRLGREPTEDEINEARNALMRQRYADMALTAVLFKDESDTYDFPTQSVRDAGRAVEDQKFGEGANIASEKEDAAPVRDFFRELFDRVALPSEHFDDEWTENICDLIRSEGCLVGRQEWDSGGPGAGAGIVVVYQFRGLFIGDNDVDIYGPYDSFADAAAAVGLFAKTSATKHIWVDPRFR
jgi:hypothetical protein